jgi:formylglycine-generating enzyme required for sulfatase activity
MLTEGTILNGRYLIKEKIDKGGQGNIYVAEDQQQDNQFVAIKEAFHAAASHRQQFEREARLLKNLNHPALPRVIEYFTEGNDQFIVMEFIPGENLDTRLSNGEKFEPDQIAVWAGRLLDLLEYLHAQKPPVIHRDIKPANLKLKNGEIILLDFGLAKNLTTNTLLGKSFVGGTPAYAPPEQISGTGTDARSDLFSLGATLHHLLTRLPPTKVEVRWELLGEGYDAPVQPEKLMKRNLTDADARFLSKALAHFLSKALALDPEKRFQTAAEMHAALQQAQPVPPDLASFEFTTVTLDSHGRVIARPNGSARQFIEDLGYGVKLEMVEIPAGEFMMGSTEAEVQTNLAEAKRYNKDAKLEWISRETPRHRVSVPGFAMGKYAVTQAQWRAVAKLPKLKLDLNPEPSHFKGDDLLPVESVNWEEAAEFCKRLSHETGRSYRLPSEAEWEYACRAGTTTPFAFGETITPQVVNYDGNYPYASAPKGESRQKTVPVGSLGVANGFGLFDLHGNVWEWCEDVWHPDYNGAPDDGRAWTTGGDQNYRLLRGGSWVSYGFGCRSATRLNIAPGVRNGNNGFRVVVSARTP